MPVPITQHLNDGTPSTINLDVCSSNASLHDIGNKIKDPKRVTLMLHEARNIALKETRLFSKDSKTKCQSYVTHGKHASIFLVSDNRPSLLSQHSWVPFHMPVAGKQLHNRHEHSKVFFHLICVVSIQIIKSGNVEST